MEALRQDDPRHIGPYRTLVRLRETASAVQYLAHGADGTTAVVTVPRSELAGLPACRRHFAAEARTGERLAGGWVPALLDSRTDGTGLWTAGGYLPALTLGEAIVLAGPLPERTVRILGAALAETLSRVHASGTVLQGLAPDTVLLAVDGPRLTAFGALGAAASAEAHDGGKLSVRLGYLTPEQIAGTDPGPASDVFVLGLLLTYAATGTTPFPDADRIAHAEPELSSVPAELRDLVARCLAKDPAERPAAGAVAAELALEGAAALARNGWLPGRLMAAVTEQAAQVMALESGQPVRDGLPAVDGSLAHATDRHVPVGGGAPAAYRPDTGSPSPSHGYAPFAPGGDGSPGYNGALPTMLDGGVAPAGAGQTPPTAPAAATAPAPSRRALLAGIVGAAAGLVVGGGGVLAFASEDGKKADSKGAAPRKQLPGVAPDPLWYYKHPTDLSLDGTTATTWRDRVLLIMDEENTTGVDLRTGRKLWERETGNYTPVAVDDTLYFVVGGTDFLWVSALDGLVKHRFAYADTLTKGARTNIGQVLASDGAVVWLTAHVAAAKKARSYVIAYDMAARKELWRSAVPTGASFLPGYEAVGVRPDAIMLRQRSDTLTPAQKKKAKGLSVFRLIDRKSGKQLWRKSFAGVREGAGTNSDPAGPLYAAVAGNLHAYDTASGKRLWRLDTKAPVLGESAPYGFGSGALHDKTLYVGSSQNEVYAVDTATGDKRWKRSTEDSVQFATPSVSISSSGRTVVALNRTQVTAISAQDGRRLWKFQDSGPRGVTGDELELSNAYQGAVSGRRFVVWRNKSVYALPLA